MSEIESGGISWIDSGRVVKDLSGGSVEDLFGLGRSKLFVVIEIFSSVRTVDSSVISLETELISDVALTRW